MSFDANNFSITQKFANIIDGNITKEPCNSYSIIFDTVQYIFAFLLYFKLVLLFKSSFSISFMAIIFISLIIIVSSSPLLFSFLFSLFNFLSFSCFGFFFILLDKCIQIYLTLHRHQFKLYKIFEYQMKLYQILCILLTENVLLLSKMHKKNHSPHKKQSIHPKFLINDDQQGSYAYCPTCAQYEEDISILQQKLMETHNKLIEQIDISREQQIKIVKLRGNRVRQFGREQQNNTHTINSNQKTSGRIYRKNDEQNIHNIEQQIQARTQLLRNDLQEMRNKILSEINKNNRLKQQIRQVQANYDKQMKENREKIRRLEGNKNKLIDENERLLQKIEELKRLSTNTKQNIKCTCGFESKYYELDKAFISQKAVINQLIEENNRLKNKIHDLYEVRVKEQTNEYSQNKGFQIRTQPKKKKNTPKNNPTKQQQYEDTKNLIKRLEQAQFDMRNKQQRIL